MSKDYFQIDQADWDDLKRENERLRGELAKSQEDYKLMCVDRDYWRELPFQSSVALLIEKQQARIAQLETLINSQQAIEKADGT